MSDLSKKRSCLPDLYDSDRGFTFVEVVIALGLTTLVLGAVFSLLAKGMKTAPAESIESDLQAQARHALERVSADILLAGTDLPLEFPAFTPPGVNPFLDRSGGGPDAVEIIGHYHQDALGSGPTRVVSFDGQTALLETVPVQIERGQLVLIYDGEPRKGTWMFGIVSAVHTSPQPALTLVTEPAAVVDETQLPPFIENYNRNQPRSGFLTPVTVVTYVVTGDREPLAIDRQEGERVLWRQVNWGPPVQVAYVEDLQIRYFVGGTVKEQPYVSYGVPEAQTARARGKKEQELELSYPPVPQPNPHQLLQLDGVVRGVRVLVTSRSREANLEGAMRLPGQSQEEEGYLRATYSTRVSTRNLLYNLHARQNLEGFN